LFVDPLPVNSCSCFFSSDFCSDLFSSSYYGILKLAEITLDEISFSSLFFWFVWPKLGSDEFVFSSFGFEFFVAI